VEWLLSEASSQSKAPCCQQSVWSRGPSTPEIRLKTSGFPALRMT